MLISIALAILSSCLLIKMNTFKITQALLVYKMNTNICDLACNNYNNKNNNTESKKLREHDQKAALSS